ncbi:MAG: M48 family metallopeptidase [Nitrospirae bacterium]|nr:M48 family metallopeptidase [Nitrospirota bacterium]
MNINYSIVYSERKTISIIVERDRSVIVRAPLNTSKDVIAGEIEKRKRLLQKKIEHNQKYPYIKQTKEFVSGESLLYMGKNYKLFVIDEHIEGVMFDSKFFISKDNQKQANELFKEWYINSATEIIVPKAVTIARQLGVTFNNINILDLKYRWGSCTPRDNIHLNWRLIKAPMTVIEYIIVHELTHLLVSNHTPEFWNRIAVQQPNYTKAKGWLREFGHELEKDF